MSTIIFCMTHKAFTPPPDPMFVPIQVGRALHEDLGYVGDDTGDSISTLNPYFSELTGMYWVWKNFKMQGNVGLCHYRRFLMHEDGRVLTQEDYDTLLQEYDMVTTKQVKLNNSYYDGYAKNHHIKDLDETGKVIFEFFPEYYNTYHEVVHGNRTYFGNMIVCRKELFDAYSNWLFGILLRLKERIDIENYDNYRKRVFGFISEILLLVYVKHNRLSVYECMVYMPGEKTETKEVKERIQACFAAGDVKAAGVALQEALKKRPDILMESSDVDGHLMLALELITICEQEGNDGRENIVSQIRDFDKLIEWVLQLNKLAEANEKEQMDIIKLERILLQKNISKQAYEVALVVTQRKRKISLND